MYATYVATSMTQKLETQITASSREQLSRTFLRIGYAQSAESTRTSSARSKASYHKRNGVHPAFRLMFATPKCLYSHTQVLI